MCIFPKTSWLLCGTLTEFMHPLPFVFMKLLLLAHGSLSFFVFVLPPSGILAVKRAPAPGWSRCHGVILILVVWSDCRLCCLWKLFCTFTVLFGLPIKENTVAIREAWSVVFAIGALRIFTLGCSCPELRFVRHTVCFCSWAFYKDWMLQAWLFIASLFSPDPDMNSSMLLSTRSSSYLGCASSIPPKTNELLDW